MERRSGCMCLYDSMALDNAGCDIVYRSSRYVYIEDIYFFGVNTKYISSSVLKTSEFS